MSTRNPLLLVAVSTVWWSCAERPPFVVLTIEDPMAVASDFVELGIGFSPDTLSEAKVGKKAFPVTVTVTATTAGDNTVWVEAWAADDTALARGTTGTRFARKGTPTATIRLARVCTSDTECSGDSFCSAKAECLEGMCVTVGPPCVSNFPCVQTTCVDLGDGQGTCEVTPDDMLCPADEYCSAEEGCLPNCGNESVDTGETCDDGDARDTGNGCSATCQRNDVCGDGVAQILFESCDDGDSDECNGCRTDCARGCVCTAPGACLGSEWCDRGTCIACDVPEHCGPSCVACPGTTPLCGGATVGCACDPNPAPHGSCGFGSYCDAGACSPCDDVVNCGPECVPCSGDTPVCGGAEVGCIIDPPTDCTGRPDFTPCRVASPNRSYDVCMDGACVEPGCGAASCNPSGPSFARADTGWQYPDSNQRVCSDASTQLTSCPGVAGTAACDTTPFCGQDAQYGWDTTHAESERWTRTNQIEAVVADHVTGLDWQGCSAGRSGVACEAGVGDIALNWVDAVVHCDELVWGGYSDWRLPDAHELVSLVDWGVGDPAADAAAFPETPPIAHWTATTLAADEGSALSVNFLGGAVSNYGKGFAFSVRCTRSTAAALGTQPRFDRDIVTVPAEPTVADAKSGLVWQGCPGGSGGASCTGASIPRRWELALSYCESLTWAGTSDWRVPNVVELLSIVDWRASDPSLDNALFPGMPAGVGAFWTASSHGLDATSAWVVLFQNGQAVPYDKSNAVHARCVRDGP